MSPTVNKKNPKRRFIGAEAYTVSVTASDTQPGGSRDIPQYQ